MLSYQDAYLPDRVEPGERDCAERWKLITPHLPRTGLVLDVGSNLGYYGLRAVQAEPQVAVISIEADPDIARRQRDIAATHGTDRLCLVQGRVDARLTADWARTCDWLDLTLLLSVLHWVDDPDRVLRHMASMSSRLILELPDGRDRACGRSKIRRWGSDPVGWATAVTGRRVSTLGRVGRHTSDVDSHLLLVEGPTRRVPARPYWDAVFPHPEANDYRLDFDGGEVRLAIRGRPVVRHPGINLTSLMKLGRLLYPSAEILLAAGAQAIDAARAHGDPYPHNMLWSASGIELIDGDDQETATSRERAASVLERTLASWAAGRTRHPHAYVRELVGPARYVRRRVGRALRRLTSDEVVENMKMRLGL